MEIVFHCGAHGTDNGRIAQSLEKNWEGLHKKNAEFIPPLRYGGLLESALQSLDGGTATEEMEYVLLDALLTSTNPERVILSSPDLLGSAKNMIGEDGLYPAIGQRLNSLANLFPNSTTEIFIAIRNPATMLSDALKDTPQTERQALLESCQPANLRWNKVIRGIVDAVPGKRLVFWCNEDLPLIWPEVMRGICDIPSDSPLAGSQDLIKSLLTPEGNKALAAANAERETLTVQQRRTLHSELLRDYALPEEMTQEIDLPGWTQETVDDVSMNYYRDAPEIAALPGVEFILP